MVTGGPSFPLPCPNSTPPISLFRFCDGEAARATISDRGKDIGLEGSKSKSGVILWIILGWVDIS